MSISAQLQQVQKQIADLQRMKDQLEEQNRLDEARKARLEELVATSGYENPKALAEALIEKFNLKITSTTAGASTGRRKRTTVTAPIRDEVKATVASGLSKNKAAKKLGISYAVVTKIIDGVYDHV